MEDILEIANLSNNLIINLMHKYRNVSMDLIKLVDTSIRAAIIPIVCVVSLEEEDMFRM